MKTKLSSKIRNSLLAVMSIAFAITFGIALGGVFNTTALAEATATFISTTILVLLR